MSATQTIDSYDVELKNHDSGNPAMITCDHYDVGTAIDAANLGSQCGYQVCDVYLIRDNARTRIYRVCKA